MRQKLFFLVIFSFLFFQCEKIGEDIDTTTPPSDDTVGLVENAQSIYYTWQGKEVVLDMKMLVDLPNVTAVNIVKQPILGKVIFENNLLNYQPNDNIVEANDQFEIEIKGKNGKTKIETIYIGIQAENSEIPCHFGALPDFYVLKKGQSTTFDVIANDKFCDVTYVDNSLKVIKNTKNGTLTAAQNKISFTPNTVFDKGNDLGIYALKAKNKDGKIIERIGIIKIEIEEITLNPGNCTIKLINDFVVLPSKLINDTIKLFPLLNDKLCTKNGTLSIDDNPKHGVAKVNQNSILYIPDDVASPKKPDDLIKYKYCENGSCATAVINIIRKDTVKTGTGCLPKLQNDEYNISIKNPKINISKGYLLVDVLANDVLCDKQNAKTIVLKNVAPATAKIKVDDFFIRYDAQDKSFIKGEEVIFEYEITTIAGQKFSAKGKIKFVD